MMTGDPLTLFDLIPEDDLGLCPYNQRGREGADLEGICFQMGICANPNEPEPHCHTDCPQEGWLSDRLLDIFGRDDLDVPLTELAELIALGRSFRDSYGP